MDPSGTSTTKVPQTGGLAFGLLCQGPPGWHERAKASQQCGATFLPAGVTGSLRASQRRLSGHQLSGGGSSQVHLILVL